MLSITIPAVEVFDDESQMFFSKEEVTLELEHSLVSISKWESKWEKPFLGSTKQTLEETYWYLKSMTLNGDIPIETYHRLSNDELKKINEYVDAKMSATWFNEKTTPGRKEIITSEIIYYWMVALTIPFECQHWHLNRLLTLIKVCNQKNEKPKKMSRGEMLAQRNALNAKRQAEFGTTG